ncbi:hypothetical protein VNO78_35912 [Psophocarpus tetragonolobus]|uniref:Uncharacterized protein n=1 Tax=Psophocarpus tetragonolobus TaxID=3891 RepID=A0AAN9NRJ6_PSOTE
MLYFLNTYHNSDFIILVYYQMLSDKGEVAVTVGREGRKQKKEKRKVGRARPGSMKGVSAWEKREKRKERRKWKVGSGKWEVGTLN